MRLVIQRVRNASVAIDGKTVSEIGQGLLVLVGVEVGDTKEDMKWLVGKTVGLLNDGPVTIIIDSRIKE